MSSCEKLAKVAVGEEFPRNLMEFLDKFGTDETCLGYLECDSMAGRVYLPGVRFA